MATGMLDALFAPKQKDLLAEERAEEQRLQFQASDPFRATAHAVYEGSTMAGKGLGRAAAAAMGGDSRTPSDRQVDAIERAKAEIAAMEDVDFSTPAGVDRYYLGVINILRRNGLPGEAHAAALEWNKHKNEAADRGLKVDELNRKKAADEAKAAELKRKNEIAAERNKALADRGLPEIVRIVNAIEKETDPVSRDRLVKYANAQIESKKKGVILENAGDRVIVRDKATGEVIGTDIMGEKPMTEQQRDKATRADAGLETAYKAAMLAMQTAYKAAVDLYNSPGLDNLIGKWSGIAAETGPEKGGFAREAAIARLTPAGQEALSLFNQVQGATFIQALLDLKAAGKGSTGLGAVSEVEGNKIQAAKGSLWPRQQPESFRRKLADYVSTIEAAANNLAGKAKEDGLSPIHLNIVPLTGPIRGRAAEPASPTPKPAEPAAGEPTVRLFHPKTKKPWNILRSKVDEAKRRGFTEKP